MKPFSEGQSSHSNYRWIPDTLIPHPCRLSKKSSFAITTLKSWQHAFHDSAEYNSIAQLDSLHFRFLTSVNETLSTLSARCDLLMNGPCLEHVQRFWLPSWHAHAFQKQLLCLSSEFMRSMRKNVKDTRKETQTLSVKLGLWSDRAFKQAHMASNAMTRIHHHVCIFARATGRRSFSLPDVFVCENFKSLLQLCRR